MTRKASSDHPQNNANRVLRDACVSFDEHLKAFIKNAHNDQDAAHVAAQVLFEVRRLENALSSPLQALPIRLAGCQPLAGCRQQIISPVDKEDL